MTLESIRNKDGRKYQIFVPEIEDYADELIGVVRAERRRERWRFILRVLRAMSIL